MAHLSNRSLIPEFELVCGHFFPPIRRSLQFGKIHTKQSYLQTCSLDQPNMFKQRGETAPVVVHIFENKHMLRHVLGWGGVNVHVNLLHMHMLRHVLGWGGERSC